MWFVAGLLSGLAILFLLLKLDFHKVLYFDVAVDILASILLMILFAGTFSGMMSAIVGGVVVSIALYVAKRTVGYKKLTQGKWYSCPQWETVKGEWRAV